MLILKILGWLWVLLGIWGALRPNSVKKRLRTRFRRTMRWLCLALLVSMSGVLISAFKTLEGIPRIAVPVVGGILLFQGLAFFRGKTSDAVIDWWEKQSPLVYRLAGVATLGAGLGIQWLTRTSEGS